MALIFTASTNAVFTSQIQVANGGPHGFLHSFGGPPKHEGAVFHGCDKPLQLLYTFDLSDSRVPVRLPGIRWLPLYYAFIYDASPIYYRIASDQQVVIVRQEETQWTDGFPYSDLPDAFPFRWAEVSDLRPLEDVIKAANGEELWKEMLEEDAQAGIENDSNDLIALASGLWQGAPKTECINPDCEKQTMNVLAVVYHDDVDGVSFWGPSGDEEGIQIVYEICPLCAMLRATNQCT